MTLTAYIKNKDRREALALACETSPDYLWQIATHWRGRRAGPDLARKINAATQGRVSLSELRPDLWPSSEAA